MRYFVTYTAMNNQRTAINSQLANPLWHAFVSVSIWEGPGHKVEVTDAWGFYAAERANPNSLLSKIKSKAGFNFDFAGNFGRLKHEEIRFLDLGYGLQGVTAEISLQQYQHLAAICEERIALEGQAIADAKARLGNDHPSSVDIYKNELQHAQDEGLTPHLQEFGFKARLKCGGITLSQSNTCKTSAVQLLQEIKVNATLIDEITKHHTSMAIPRRGGTLEYIYLHSTGPVQKHTRRNGDVSFFRSWNKDNGTKVFWTAPPQRIVTDSEDIRNYFRLDEDKMEACGKVISQLQQIEHEIMNALMTDEMQPQRQALVDSLCRLYTAFTTLNSSTPHAEIDAIVNRSKQFLADLAHDMNRPGPHVIAQLPEKVKEKINAVLGIKVAQPVYSPA